MEPPEELCARNVHGETYSGAKFLRRCWVQSPGRCTNCSDKGEELLLLSAPTVRTPHRGSEVIADPLGGLADRIVRQVCIPRRRSGLPVTEERTDEVK